MRSPSSRWGAGIYTAFALLGAAVPVMNEFSITSLVVGLFTCALFGVLASRGWRSHIRIDESGVLGRADRFTHRLAWSDIDHFEYRPLGGLGAVTQEGQWVRLADYGVFADSSAHQHLSELQTALAQHR